MDPKPLALAHVAELQLIRDLVAQAEKRLAASQAQAAMDESYLAGLRAAHHALLERMRNYEAHRAIAESDAARVREGTLAAMRRDAVLRALRVGAPRALSPVQIVELVEHLRTTKDGEPLFDKWSIRDTLRELTETGIVIRVSHGAYSLPEYAHMQPRQLPGPERSP